MVGPISGQPIWLGRVQPILKKEGIVRPLVGPTRPD